MRGLDTDDITDGAVDKPIDAIVIDDDSTNAIPAPYEAGRSAI